ncbi:uncharacterized protein DSM5745_01191 [Aspergillus mulundensis]|uniref:Uncharacterized protein n=1 Tax=Aspergillus mulundensis TaxID=1810919 RepID=A0A3D8T5Q9_9EURO|nr:Uncharacterized protein DSM5745_01191 [Aspergillus mulundensis]RDW93869.1 Uncharacterized protein DSM5745_01191 [Aspergillus mulundensis]
MSENPTQQVKDTVYAAAATSSEWAQQNVVNPIREYVAGEKNEEAEVKPNISDEESETIDRMEKEKVADFLRERHKSDAPIKKR